jgi:hypothetical protein
MLSGESGLWDCNDSLRAAEWLMLIVGGLAGLLILMI